MKPNRDTIKEFKDCFESIQQNYMSSYFVIKDNDGEITVEKLSKVKLLKRLNEEYYGEVNFKQNVDRRETVYRGDDVVIIKGEIVVPVPVVTVNRYEID
jgi:hypothetical protein